jgi:hypothetical protein
MTREQALLNGEEELSEKTASGTYEISKRKRNIIRGLPYLSSKSKQDTF